MGRIFERQNSWWVDFKDATGTRRRIKISPDKKIANEALKSYEGKVAREEHLGIIEDSKISFADFADHWLAKVTAPMRPNTREQWTRLVRNHFKPFFTGGLSAITASKVGDYKAMRLKDGMKPNTIHSEMIVIKHLLARAVEWGALSRNPVRDAQGNTASEVKSKPGEGRSRYLKDEEVDALLDACDKDLHAEQLGGFVRIALNTGMRRGEILGIDAKRIDWAARKVTIIDRKNGKDLVVNLNSVAFATLKALCANRIAGPVFTIKVRALTHAFARARKRAGIEDFHIHDLRHHFASQILLQKQGDLSTVQRLLGHSTIKSTERYAHLSDEHLKQAVEGLVIGTAK